VVVLSRHAFSAVGPLVETGPAEAVADFSLRARRRGFLDVVDPSTQVTGPATPPDRRWLVERHPFIAALLDDASAAVEAPLAVVHATARARARGLRILVDGSWLGSWEMGTQVQAVAMVQALARRDDVERVTMALPAVLPAGARQLLGGPKVDARADTGGNLAGLGPADVVHRPFQPDWPLDVGAWRREAARTVVTILDLIAYTVGSYHPSGEHWVAHRRTIAQTVEAVDGVVVISHDVAVQVRRERLAVENDRLFVVGLGTDHLQWDAPESKPAALAGTSRFVLVLGADYAHKNRDLAVRAHAELVRRGLGQVGLVLVGPSVAYGSSRVTEAAAGGGGAAAQIVRLPNVPAAERNWLLRHADVVLYPTSAEGFGLVPHEAARLGTPTVMVPVGPLVDLAARLPVTAASWAPEALADAAEALLWDPTLAAAQVQATLAAGRDLTWDATAARLVDVYRALLARPAVR
jgi:glycosyltransferase involved in cell wall biosynthesis